MPRFTTNKRFPTDVAEFDMIKRKVEKVRIRRYISGGTVLSLTAFFYVPNGDDDTRLVHDLTASGLNDALWYPSFWMPSIDNVLYVATHLSWFR